MSNEARVRVEFFGLQHAAQGDGRDFLVRHFHPDGGLTRNRRLDANTGGSQIQGDVVREIHDAADLDASLGLQLVPGDGGAAADIQQLAGRHCGTPILAVAAEIDLAYHLHLEICPGQRQQAIADIEQDVAEDGQGRPATQGTGHQLQRT